MELQPLADRVVVLPIDDPLEQQTEAGLYLPDSASGERYHKGKVVAVGSGILTPEGLRVPTESKVGDLVLYGTNRGTDVTLDRVKYLILRETDILAIHHKK
jgi:chaperonin GroES